MTLRVSLVTSISPCPRSRAAHQWHCPWYLHFLISHSAVSPAAKHGRPTTAQVREAGVLRGFPGRLLRAPSPATLPWLPVTAGFCSPVSLALTTLVTGGLWLHLWACLCRTALDVPPTAQMFPQLAPPPGFHPTSALPSHCQAQAHLELLPSLHHPRALSERLGSEPPLSARLLHLESHSCLWSSHQSPTSLP